MPPLGNLRATASLVPSEGCLVSFQKSRYSFQGMDSLVDERNTGGRERQQQHYYPNDSPPKRYLKCVAFVSMFYCSVPEIGKTHNIIEIGAGREKVGLVQM